MRSKNELYLAAMRTISARRQAARARAEDERARAEAAIPALRHAEEEFRLRGIRCAMTAAQGGDRAAAQVALAAAKNVRDELLRQSGRSPECLAPKFSCKACSDTGSVNGKTCDCVRRLMQKLRREEIEAMSSLSVSSFDSMKLNYYPDVRDPMTGRSVRRYMEGVLDDLRQYAEEFDHDSASLFLTGNAGLGKTHAALAIAGAVLARGYDVIYISSPDFFSHLEALHFGADPTREEEALLDAVTAADLLVFDDLGTELISAFTISTFYTLLNNRMASHRPTIFTSNITDGAVLEKRYTEKIASRLSGSCEPFVFLGRDIRAIKAAE